MNHDEYITNKIQILVIPWFTVIDFWNWKHFIFKKSINFFLIKRKLNLIRTNCALYSSSFCWSLYFNIATDEYIFKHIKEDCFMLWQNDNAIIVGKHQNTLAEINIVQQKITSSFSSHCCFAFLVFSPLTDFSFDFQDLDFTRKE